GCARLPPTQRGPTRGRFGIHLGNSDVKGDPKAIEGAAKSLEKDTVDLVYTVGTSVATVAKRATTEVPIVFAGGSDPVAAGLIESHRDPGVTGVHYSLG